MADVLIGADLGGMGEFQVCTFNSTLLPVELSGIGFPAQAVAELRWQIRATNTNWWSEANRWGVRFVVVEDYYPAFNAGSGSNVMRYGRAYCFEDCLSGKRSLRGPIKAFLEPNDWLKQYIMDNPSAVASIEVRATWGNPTPGEDTEQRMLVRVPDQPSGYIYTLDDFTGERAYSFRKVTWIGNVGSTAADKVRLCTGNEYGNNALGEEYTLALWTAVNSDLTRARDLPGQLPNRGESQADLTIENLTSSTIAGQLVFTD
jgi:hypothetical protein